MEIKKRPGGEEMSRPNRPDFGISRKDLFRSFHLPKNHLQKERAMRPETRSENLSSQTKSQNRRVWHNFKFGGTEWHWHYWHTFFFFFSDVKPDKSNRGSNPSRLRKIYFLYRDEKDSSSWKRLKNYFSYFPLFFLCFLFPIEKI